MKSIAVGGKSHSALRADLADQKRAPAPQYWASYSVLRKRQVHVGLGPEPRELLAQCSCVRALSSMQRGAVLLESGTTRGWILKLCIVVALQDYHAA